MIKALIEINVYLGFLVLIYFATKSYVTSSFKRNYLRFSPLLATGIYVIKLFVLSSSSNSILPHIQLEVISVGLKTEQAITTSSGSFTLANMYLIGVFVFMMFSLVKVFKALSFFRKSTYLAKEKVWLSNSDLEQSFTFLNRIHLSNQLTEQDRALVLEHELLHVRFKHSIDLLLLEGCHALLWFNPLFIIIKKQLITVHENQVDQAMYHTYHQTYLKFLVASTMGVSSSQILLTSQFYNGLSLTQRVKQMKTNMKNNWAVLAMIPVFALGLVFISFTTNQTVIPKMAIQQTDSIYDYADTNPEFPGGPSEMTKFISENVVYPKEEVEKGIEGTVYCEFVVRKSGKIKDIKIVKSVSSGIDKEAMRVVALMPMWKPGIKDGTVVNVRFTIPFKFRLGQEK